MVHSAVNVGEEVSERLCVLDAIGCDEVRDAGADLLVEDYFFRIETGYGIGFKEGGCDGGGFCFGVDGDGALWLVGAIQVGVAEGSACGGDTRPDEDAEEDLAGRHSVSGMHVANECSRNDCRLLLSTVKRSL